MSWLVTIGGLWYNVVIILIVYACIKVSAKKRCFRRLYSSDETYHGTRYATIAPTHRCGILTAQRLKVGTPSSDHLVLPGSRCRFYYPCRFMAPCSFVCVAVTIPDMLGKMFGPFFLAIAVGCLLLPAGQPYPLKLRV